MAESPSVTAIGVVERVERVSPSFARVTFTGADLAAFGTPGATFDQRIKVVFPSDGGRLSSDDPLRELRRAGDWWSAWQALPEGRRGSMRTYSIRDVAVDGEVTRVVVDFVLHLAPGLTGPASRWADAAAPGDELLLIGPRRGHSGRWGGIEYDPGAAKTIVLAGDETAAPAIARILEDAAPETRGVAFIEVPDPADELPIAAPAGVEVRWLPRPAALAHGEVLIPAVLSYLGASAERVTITDTGTGDDDLVWETPQFSRLGEDLPAADNHADRYFWIAGESGVVTTLRRQLVKELGVDRAQVAFMGYWRKGVAMRG